MTRRQVNHTIPLTRTGDSDILIRQITQVIDAKRTGVDKLCTKLDSSELDELKIQLKNISDAYGILGSTALRQIASRLKDVPECAYQHNLPGLLRQIDAYRKNNQGELPSLDLLGYYVKSVFTNQREAALLPSHGLGRMPGDSGRCRNQFTIQDKY